MKSSKENDFAKNCAQGALNGQRFSETSDHPELRSMVRQFSSKKLLAIVKEDENAARFRPEIIRELGDLGLCGIATREEWGGAGLGYTEYAMVIEELARSSAAYAISVAVSGLPQVILSIFGSDDQKKKFVPLLASGQMIGAFSLSESTSGSDAGSLKTVATRDGDHYVINGSKQWCTQADDAGIILLMARTGGKGPSGISTFIVEKGTKGLTIGKKEKKMGCHISHTCEVFLENCRIPASNLVGNEGDGFKIAMTALDSGRITIAATALGLSKAAFETAQKYAVSREQFGKPIAEFQSIQFMLADMAVAISASELLIRQAAKMRDQGHSASIEAAAAKLFATDTAMKITTDAVQILGGAGYTEEFNVERLMREAKVLQIVEGTNQVQRIVIGRHLLKEAKEGRYL